ncbi:MULTISPECIES: hypothetical protein [Stenotrophomonas]|uniref:Uncharacterized protein n=1 Tax=Stenotrophomonas maltophilia TaxID=40324 RepID=A0AAI9BZS2_STEMA|nr:MULTISPECIES: hypothetical protein [Stenotrophomonas]UUS14897.1 hypothetical protein NMB32_02215 [Stenotrophomonas sp. CD2]EKT4091504.1 hypothetical protein [Stenotrophomonas maltophilia]ELF4100190.1 hypothetical protein [Stenotrophomonas maltophilia]MBA0284422.1 hypothetical protein [Stenotrophomonas maltophilia]MBA0323689.1 hypothetical protein [Stenotrophomonas maltophilia]
MNDVEHDLPDSLQTDFPSLMDWDEVIQDDREDRLGFARRTTYALLTLSGAELVEGFDGGNQKALEEARRTVALFQADLRRQAWFAEAAEKRLERVAEVLAAAG